MFLFYSLRLPKQQVQREKKKYEKYNYLQKNVHQHLKKPFYLFMTYELGII